MQIEIIAIGNKMPDWVASGFADYQRRLPKHLKLSLREIAISKSHRNNTQQQIEEEGQKILKAINNDNLIVALDVKGKTINSVDLAQLLDKWQILGKTIKIIIGGANGLSDDCKRRADLLLSLSALTLPHQIVKLVFTEQLYRACTINSGHPYHRE